jgi:type I restriction-modification system DNA methylase subunit
MDAAEYKHVVLGLIFLKYIYDPCCGSGGMFVQSEKFVEAHGGKLGDISIYGQESNSTTRRLAVMNLALRGIEADFGPEPADTFRRDLHPDLQKIIGTYHAWRSHPRPSDGRGAGGEDYQDIPGFCKSATTAEIAGHGHVLTPGRYVGAEEVADDGEPFEEKMPRLVAELHAQFAESAKLG